MARPLGISGIHIFKIAGASISGWAPFWKGDVAGRQAMPFTSEHENRAALALLFDPRVAYAQRADVNPEFADAHRLVHRLPTPVSIPYVDPDADDGGSAIRDYLPDYVGVLASGAPFLAEAGPARAKAAPAERAKAAAARDEMDRRGGSFFLITGSSLSQVRLDNYGLLRAHYPKPEGFDQVAPAIAQLLLGQDPKSVRWVVARLAAEFNGELVAESTWRVLCLAAAHGHLVADLDRELLTTESEVLLLPAGAAPILPPELPSNLPSDTDLEDEAALPDWMVHDGIEASHLSANQARLTIRNERFIELVRSGQSIEDASRAVGISRRQGFRVQEKARSARDRPQKTAFRTSAHPMYVEVLHKMLRQPRTLRVRAIRESPEMLQAWHRIHETGQVEPIPSRKVISRLRDAIMASDVVVRQRIDGVRHPERPARAVRRYVLSIPAPGLVCQVDEHVFDILLTLDDVEVASRVWGAVLVCVKTGALLGAVLSPAELVEEDYMRLLKQAIEPKDRVVERFGCDSDWTCSARPGEILSDRGLIFRSARSTSVVIDRLGITQKVAPPWAPSAKGTVEAIFRFMTERFAHRFAATTKGSPRQRGLHDPVVTAKRVRMTFPEFEAYFYRAVVDGYMQAYDDLRGGVRAALWDDAVRKHGAPRYIGSDDTLKLLLMRAANRKHPLGRYRIHRGGVSFLDHWYVGHDGLTAALRATRESVDILYDRRDITTIYLVAANGLVLGAASTDELGPGPVSVWERDARRRLVAGPRAMANERSSAALTAIQAEASQAPSRRARRAANRRSYRELTFANQVDDIHLAGVQRERSDLARRRASERDGVIRLRPELPGPDFTDHATPRPRIEYLDRDA